MHYIRLLRPPKLRREAGDIWTELVLAITTDLGDALLWPPDAIELEVWAQMRSRDGEASCRLSSAGALQWRPGQRVAKPICRLPRPVQEAMASGDRVELWVGTRPQLSADGLDKVLAASSQEGGGLVMPVGVVLRRGEGEEEKASDEEDDDHVCIRRLHLGPGQGLVEQLETEEALGESMARHVWDGGVVTVCALAAALRQPELESSQKACMRALRSILLAGNGRGRVNVLELGCGVGMLGAALGAVLPAEAGDCTILMTDLDDAERRVRSNIALLQKQQKQKQKQQQQQHGSRQGARELLFERLDWEQGRRGRFGREARGRRWDLIMMSECTYNADTLPALVGTLSALAAVQRAEGEEAAASKVFLTTKPRHPSERAFFDQMSEADWVTVEKQEVRLPVLGGEEESVEMYLFEKR